MLLDALHTLGSVHLATSGPPDNATTAGEAITFWILGPIALAGGLGMLFSRNAVHSALWLVLTMFSLGVLYMVQQAPFLGFVQIIVYTGAIMMLFLFVLMMVGRDSSDSVVEVLRGQRLWAGILGVGIAGLIVGVVANSLTEVTSQGLAQENSSASGGNVANIGRSLFTDFLFPFELTSALLITAAIGAILLAYTGRTPRGSKPGQRELVNMRFRGEHARPSPLPGPGVFATADSVATPALLPDGSVSQDSLSDIIESATAEQYTAERTAITDTGSHPDARSLRGGPGESDGSGQDVPQEVNR
jgi:NADH-quinone oxidoreductase subunit J